MAKRAKARTASRRTAAKSRVAPKGAAGSKAAKKTRAAAGRCKAVAKKAAAGKTTAAKRTMAKRSLKAGCAKAKTTVTQSGKKAPAAKTVKRKTTPRKTPSRRTASASQSRAASSQGLMPVHPADRPLPKTRLSDARLEQFQQLLLEKRAELAGDVQQLTREVLSRPGMASSDRTTMPIHMADVGSDNWEQELTLGLIDNERTVVQEIDEALARIANRTYGTCLATRKRISLARLRAKPWAKYCIEYARLRDEGRAP